MPCPGGRQRECAVSLRLTLPFADLLMLADGMSGAESRHPCASFITEDRCQSVALLKACCHTPVIHFLNFGVIGSINLRVRSNGLLKVIFRFGNLALGLQNAS